MKPNKNIDRLFQEKLRDLEVAPPDIVWKNIESRLNEDRERRIFPIWFKIAGAAAILMLLTIGGINYFKNNSIEQNIENSITDIETNDVPIIDNSNLESAPQETEFIQTTITETDNTLIVDSAIEPNGGTSQTSEVADVTLTNQAKSGNSNRYEINSTNENHLIATKNTSNNKIQQSENVFV